MSLKNFFTMSSEQKYRVLIVQAIFLCVVIFFGFRALQAEILRWDFLAAFILLGCGIPVLLGMVYWLILLLYGIRAMLMPKPNGLLFFIIILGAFFAWYMPEPPMREEIKLFFNRSRYEQIAEQGRARSLAGKRECIELAYKDRDLAARCVFVEENYASFQIYRDVFSLVYSYDYQTPKAVECGWNGYVWKRIDLTWFICKSDIN